MFPRRQVADRGQEIEAGVVRVGLLLAPVPGCRLGGQAVCLPAHATDSGHAPQSGLMFRIGLQALAKQVAGLLPIGAGGLRVKDRWGLGKGIRSGTLSSRGRLAVAIPRFST